MSSHDDTNIAHDPLASGASIGSARADEEPRLVTRGETQGGTENASALVDWLGFTLHLPAMQGERWLEEVVQTVFRVPREGWISSDKGWYGYTQHLKLGPYGFLAFGGATQKETYHVELNAHGCARIQDWNAVQLWGDTYSANITRVDLAHDDFGGEIVSVAAALKWLHEGLFDNRGRPPTGRLWDDLGSGRGKTLYVGSRGAGKLLRVYEKGKQLGDPLSVWTRAEVEMRNKGRTVPWDVLTNPGKYFAGAYPAFDFLSAEQCRLRTTQRAGQITYDAMVSNLRTQGGKALGVMCQVHQGDAGAVLARVVREGVPKRLQGFGDVIGRISGGSMP
jgi:phage replication initiation protein